MLPTPFLGQLTSAVCQVQSPLQFIYMSDPLSFTTQSQFQNIGPYDPQYSHNLSKIGAYV